MDDLLDFFQTISIENSWPFYLFFYGIGLVVTIVAIRKNKKKNALKEQAEEKELDDLLK
jgi:oligoendopeptidase F